MKRKFIIILVIIMLALTNCVVIYASEIEHEELEAKVVKVGEFKNIEQENGITKKIQETKIRILEGEFETEEYNMNYVISEDITSATSNEELKEDDIIMVKVEEEDGEVISVNYIENVNQNYILYAVFVILIILSIIIAKRNAIKPLIVFIFSILIVLGAIIFSVIQKWNLIIISSIISIIITISIALKVNGINKKTGVMISCSLVGTAIAGILTYLLFDIMQLININIRISEEFINIKELFCAVVILFGGVFSNIIVLSSLNMFTFLNKPYKTKSDNIIEGQRSLKI